MRPYLLHGIYDVEMQLTSSHLEAVHTLSAAALAYKPTEQNQRTSSPCIGYAL